MIKLSHFFLLIVKFVLGLALVCFINNFFNITFICKASNVFSGGSVKWVPCSRIAHVYRGPRKYYTRPFDINQVAIVIIIFCFIL